jgi:predicted enzyme related to lactoylglutathione lyase
VDPVPDPFDALRRPARAARPRPDFVVDLRNRLRSELAMTTTDLTLTAPAPLVMVHVRVDDADRAMRFFGSLFGWEGERWDGDGHVSHYVTNTAVTVRLWDDPAIPRLRPQYGATDVAATLRAIEAAGGRVTESEVEPDGGGWATAEDRAGVPFGVYRPGGHHGESSTTPVSGDVGLVFVTEDAREAAAFYGPALGWEVVAGHPGSTYYDAVDRVGVFDHNATYGTAEPAGVDLYLEVPTLRPALGRLADLGGESDRVPTEPTMGPYFNVLCRDDQGTPFGLMSLRLE